MAWSTPLQTSRKKVTTVIVEDLNAWLITADPAAFPYEAVVGEYHRNGKHFVSDDVLDSLAAARELLCEQVVVDPNTSLLRRFLQTALDKRDGGYDYASYTALALLPMPSVDDAPDEASIAQARRDRLVVQLIADTLRFEAEAADGRNEMSQQSMPDTRTLAKRTRLAMRVAMPALQRLGLSRDGTGTEPYNVVDADPGGVARRLCMSLRPETTPQESMILRLSVLPVYVLHDEYLFIRVLQLFDTTFGLVALQLLGTVQALEGTDGAAAVSRLIVAEAALRESAPLFSWLATMDVEAFHTFRDFTHGASAIQSRNYKLLESLCRRPDRERLDSAAFASTPEVRDWVLAGNPTIDDAYESACASGRFDQAGRREEIEQAMISLSMTLRRWRQTHYRIAVRMLGERTGTGYTAGTPYLRNARNIDIFRSVRLTAQGEREAV